MKIKVKEIRSICVNEIRKISLVGGDISIKRLS